MDKVIPVTDFRPHAAQLGAWAEEAFDKRLEVSIFPDRVVIHNAEEITADLAAIETLIRERASEKPVEPGTLVIDIIRGAKTVEELREAVLALAGVLGLAKENADDSVRAGQ